MTSIRPDTLSDADMWEELVRSGKSKEEATRLVQSRGRSSPDSLRQAGFNLDTPQRPAVPSAASDATSAVPRLRRPAPTRVVDHGTGMAGMLEKGLTFGFADELRALIKTPFSGVPYREHLEEERSRDDAYAQANPGKAFVGEVTGGLLGGGVAGRVLRSTAPGARLAASYNAAGQGSRLARAGKVLAAGSVAGGLAGAGAAEEGGRLRGAVTGGAFGAGTAGALTLGGKAVSAVAAPFLPRPSSTSPRASLVRALGGETADEAARGDVLKQLGRSRVSLDALEEKAAGALPDEMLLDVGGDALVSRAGGAVATPSTGSQDIRTALKARAERTPKALRARTAEGVGVQRQNQVQLAEELIAKRREAAQPLYEKAYAAAPIDDPEVLALFGDEAFQDAYETAKRIAKREGVDLPDLPRPGNPATPVATPTGARTTGGRLRDFAQVGDEDLLAEYRHQYQRSLDTTSPHAAHRAQQTAGVMGRIEQEMARRGVSPEQWRDRLSAATVEPVAAATPSVAGLPVQAFDYVKRGLDDVIERRMRGGTIGRTEARQLRHMLSGALERVDEAVPEYRQARAQFAGDSALMEAHEQGRNFLTESSDELAAKWPTLSDGERDLYRRGALAAIEDKLKGRTDGIDATRLFRDDLMRDKLRVIFPSEQEFQAFNDDVERFYGMHGRAQSILGNSKTAERLGQMGDPAGAAIDMIGAAATGNPMSLARFGLLNAMKQRAQGLTEQHVDALAPILTAQGPELQALVRALREEAARRAQRTTPGQRLTRATSQAVGSRVAP